MGALQAVMVSGVIWALWHLPWSLLYGCNGGLVGFPAFTASTIGLAVPLSWLRLRSGSLWPAAILHASWNICLNILVVLTASKLLTGRVGSVVRTVMWTAALRPTPN